MDSLSSSPSLSRSSSFSELSSTEDFQAAQKQALEKFEKVASTSPEAYRLVMTEDRLDITSDSYPFYGNPFRFIFGKSQKEEKENRAILERFQEALLARYSNRIIDFACPSLKNRITQGSRLNAATVRQVLSDADLFEHVLEECYDPIQNAVVTDAAATLALAQFNTVSIDYSKHYQLAKDAAARREETRNAVNQFIDDYISEKKLPPNSPEAEVLQKLKTLWKPAQKDTREDSVGDLELFENITKQGQNGDRYIFNENERKVISAPRMLTGWTGATFQILAGRSKASIQENQLTIRKLKQALEKKYGYTIANFAFPTAEERIGRGSRLDGKTITDTLEKARMASQLFHHSEMTSLINEALDAQKKSIVEDHYYRKAIIALQKATENRDFKLKEASEAYRFAEDTILYHLSTHAVEQNITIDRSSRLLSLWFDEARNRFKNTQVKPSAPPMPDSDVDGDVIEEIIPIATPIKMNTSLEN